jgi:hypothetical protein
VPAFQRLDPTREAVFLSALPEGLVRGGTACSPGLSHLSGFPIDWLMPETYSFRHSPLVLRN